MWLPSLMIHWTVSPRLIVTVAGENPKVSALMLTVLSPAVAVVVVLAAVVVVAALVVVAGPVVVGPVVVVVPPPSTSPAQAASNEASSSKTTGSFMEMLYASMIAPGSRLG